MSASERVVIFFAGLCNKEPQVLSKLRDRIVIAAPQERVWALISDVVNWPEWNPNVTSIEALDGPDLVVSHRFRLKQPAQAAKIWTVTRVEDHRFGWKSEDGRLELEAGHEIVALDGGCESRLTIVISGRWRTFMTPFMSPILDFAMSRENSALKAAAEATG